jgi:hypothetical protein
MKKLVEASEKISKMQKATLDAVRKLAVLSAIDARIAEERKNIRFAKAGSGEQTSEEKDKGDKQALKALQDERDGVVKALHEAEGALTKAQDDALDATMIEGLIIARWTSTKDFSSSLDLGSDANASASAASNSKQSGYVLLAGARVSTLFFGEDFAKALKSTSPEFKGLIGEVGVTSYLLQSKGVIYSNSLDVSRSLSVLLELEAEKVAKDPKELLKYVDKVRLASYLSAAESISNRGVVGGMTWTKDNIDFESPDFNGMSSYGTKRKSGEGNFYNGWITVQSIMSRAPEVFKRLMEKPASAEGCGEEQSDQRAVNTYTDSSTYI